MLHNSGRRIISLALFDSSFTFSIVFCTLYFLLDINFQICLLLSSIAIATATGTIISLIQKKYSRGVFTKTLVGVVALNNFATILIFVYAKAITRIQDTSDGVGILTSLGEPLLVIIATITFGVATGFLLTLTSRHQHSQSDLFAISLMAILINILACRYLDFSALLVNLTMGVTYCNFSYHTAKVTKLFNNINGILFAVFFTLAGAHLDLTQLKIAGIAGAGFIIARIVAKSLAAFTASKIFGYPDAIANYLGLALVPQAGLAIGLVISLSQVPELADIAATVSTIVLAAVAVNELIGPFTTSKSFDLSKETGQATPRLIDFLQEEYIVIDLEADNKWNAIEQMTDFLVKTNHLHSITRDELLEGMNKREELMTTGLGNRLAVPHARIPAKEQLMGVIGICKQPIEWGSIDAQPVDIVILIATPEGMDNLHLKLLGAIARIFSKEPGFQKQLVASTSAAEAYDLLQSKEVRTINSYIEQL